MDLQYDIPCACGMTHRTERYTQADIAAQHGGGFVHLYLCDDGEPFSAVAMREAGAFRVLGAERPGMMARYLGVVPFAAQRK